MNPLVLAAAVSLAQTHGKFFAASLLREHGVSLEVAIELLLRGRLCKLVRPFNIKTVS
jgi:hypothetical protein